MHHRYRLSTNVLCYPLPRIGPSSATESEPKERDPAKKTPAVGKARGRDDGKVQRGVAGRGRGGTGAGVESGDASEFVSALDGALPSEMLGHLQVGSLPHVSVLRRFRVCLCVCVLCCTRHI